MTHAFHNQFDILIKTNKLYRLETELLDLKRNNNEEKIERIELLQKLIDQINARKDSQQIKEELIKNHLQVLKNSQYQKKWHTLNNLQKDDRIDEFVQRLNITDAIIATRLKKYVALGLLKTKNVTYNMPKGIIESINILTVDDDNNYHLKILADEDNEINDKEDKVKNGKKLSKSSKSVSSTKSKKIAKDNVSKSIKSIKSIKKDNPEKPVKLVKLVKATKKYDNEDSIETVSTNKKKSKQIGKN